jgi:broad specificity phosphatase PhoE
VRRALPCLLALLVASLHAGCGDTERSNEPAAAKDVALAEALRDGGVVLVMRHAKTENATDRVEVIGDCSTQRNLSAEGREQARQVGRDVKALGVPVDEVLASPMCRTTETADLAFGDSTPRRALLSAGEDATAADDRRIRKLRRMTSAPAGSATVLVTHSGNIGGAFEQSVLEGDVLVVRDGKLLGIVQPGDWKRLAEAAG